MMKPVRSLLTSVLLEPLAVLSAAGAELHWAAVRDLPDPVGLKGMIAGVAGAAVISLPDGKHLVAGGEFCPTLRTPRAFIVKRPTK